MSEDNNNLKYILVLDVGTTKLKCFIFDQNATICAEETVDIIIEEPHPGWSEINPSVIWDQIVFVMKESLKASNLSPSNITSMGLTTQRCSFVCWDKNGPLHNIITWKDKRADSLVKSWNKSFYFRAFRSVCGFLHLITQNKRYLSGSVLRLMNEQVVIRLCWVLNNIKGIKEKIAANQVKFGTLDSYLLYKLTNKEKHLTDYTNVSPTGFFDPFTLNYASWAINMFKIPTSILPKVVETCSDFGTCKIFKECEIPIKTLIADQSASMFGSACYNYGTVKVTLGTGTFLDVNTGTKPHSSISGIYPLIGWVYKDEIVYLAEGNSNCTGNIIEWGKKIGLFETFEESEKIAKSVPDSNNCSFIPAFQGLQAPYNDVKASSGFIGISPSTNKAHMVRAILQSVAFRVHQLLNVMLAETAFSFDCIRVDGGVAKNNFILQTIANLTKKRVERSANVEMTAVGCAYLCGIESGIWKSKEEVEKLYKVDKIFLPIIEQEDAVQKSFILWESSVERFLNWKNLNYQ